MLEEVHELLLVELYFLSPNEELRPVGMPRPLGIPVLPPGVGIPEALAGEVERDDSRLLRFTLKLLPVPGNTKGFKMTLDHWNNFMTV